MQFWLGYSAYPSEYYLTGQKTVDVATQFPIWHQWLIDGWFPIFPWLGYALFGVWFGSEPQNSRMTGILGIVAIVFGIWDFWSHPGPLYVRAGYSELFYPPTSWYVCVSLGTVLLLFACVKSFPRFFLPCLWGTLGRHSLFLYVFHLAVGQYVVSRIWQGLSLLPFLLVYGGGVLVFWGACWGLERWKRTALHS